jgi:hypothetical protein
MPRRVRPYGSAVDAEAAALSRGRLSGEGGPVSELASTMTAREIAGQAAEAVRALNDLTADRPHAAGLGDIGEVIARLEQMGQDLPRLCEQLARILVVQREDGQIAPRSGNEADIWVAEAVEALAAAGQAADMMAAALTQARRTAAELKSAR